MRRNQSRNARKHGISHPDLSHSAEMESRMDISSVYTQYMDQAVSNASASRLQKQTSADYTSATDEELMEACKEFEAYFVEQMFKAMEKTVMKSEGSEDNALVDYFKESLTQDYAKTATEQEGYGLAQTLYEQMKRNYSTEMIAE